MPLRDKAVALKDIKVEVELGFDRELAFSEAQRCLNCDVQTVFTGQLCIECDACVDICPMDCITFTANGDEARPAHAACSAPAVNLDAGSLRLAARSRPAASWPRTRTSACIAACAPSAARPAPGTCRNSSSRRRTPGHACRSPLERTNDFVVKFANVNGSGSASANALFAKSILRMGVPVSSRNIFPSNIQGLPTWYEVRVSRGRLSRAAAAAST